MASLLFEVGCEELPAGAVREAGAQLPELCRRHLGAEPSRLYLGPRRLAVVVTDLPERTPDEVRRGPAERAAFDEHGSPTRAAEGFARGAGVGAADLQVRDGHVWATVPGVELAAVLPDRLAALVRGLAFGKSMRWGPELRFSRPVRWLLAKLDGATIDVPLDGIRSGGVTYGHRFAAPEAAEVPHADRYEEVLRARGVEPDADVRRDAIVRALDDVGEWSDPGRVLDEVVHLVEAPLVLTGTFDERFLALPARVIVTAMQAHQRYLPLRANRFAFVANGGDADLVRAGNERVLEGRLEDASFTFERDLARGADGLAESLGAITFVAGAGSMADKARRLVRLVEALGGGEASCEAARLSKADQAAELVREFPDLEGHIGAEYARVAGYPEAVCSAIEEQYLPESAGGPLPQTEAGRVLAVAEKIDNLTVAFARDERPSGTRDPYGLRRAAIGLCRIALDSALPVDAKQLSAAAHALLVEQGADVDADPSADVHDFVAERLEGLLELPVEVVRAARGSGATDLRALAELARSIARLPEEQLAAVHTVYTRCDRLAGRKAAEAAARLDPGLLVDEAERDVIASLDRIAPQVEAAAAIGDYDRALAEAAELAPPLDRFFEDVLVMAEDGAVRANRLRLLLDVRDLVGRLGDFGQLAR